MNDVQILRQFLSDCGVWLPDDLKAALKAAVAAIEDREDDT